MIEFTQALNQRQTCKYFRNLIDDTTSLQYEIELAINLKEDGQYSSLSSRDKLKALRDHQKAWDTFEWKHDKSIPMVRGRAWEFFGNVLAQQDDAGWFTFRQLPSKYRGIEEKEWRAKPDLPRVKVFGMDPSQNLLVLIERPRGYILVYLPTPLLSADVQL
ncbi:hypothetical protein VNI00_001746 [Paramarasmius palmivorus]|uniref:Uncharacterized protein n=1 Tax=Paramarasmius palmivorus TaxID=297713 RepID=A0AAW0E6V7_9AGAR